MSYIPKDCCKCTRVIKNSKGFYCVSLKRYIHNYQITGEYETDNGVILNSPENDQWDNDCDFNPTTNYNIGDYYEPLEDRSPPWSGDRTNYQMEYEMILYDY